MTQQKQVEITRRQDIVVATVSTNSYGDLEWTDTEGGSYKVGTKRVSYFKDIILPQRAVRLNYVMSSFGKEYIYNAIPAEQIVTAKESVAKHTAIEGKPTVMPSLLNEKIPKLDQAEGQARGMVTKELGDMIRSKNLKTLFGEEIAFELVKWYRSQILGITRVSFDGAKLPQYERKEGNN